MSTDATVEQFKKMIGEHKKQPRLARDLATILALPAGGDTRTLRFTVPGKPLGAPRMTQRDKWAKRPCVMRYRAWKDSCRLAAGGTVPPVEQIVSVSWVAYFVPPASWSAKRRAAAIGNLHRSKPDRDNVDKAVLDTLFKEDSGIASGRIEKRWGDEERIEIEIVYLAPSRHD